MATTRPARATVVLSALLALGAGAQEPEVPVIEH